MKDNLKIYSSPKLFLISLGCALFVIYPEVTWIPWEIGRLEDSNKVGYILFFIFRFLYYAGFVFTLFKINLRKTDVLSFKSRLWKNIVITTLAFIVFAIIYYFSIGKSSHLGSLVLSQFAMMCLLATLLGHIITLYAEQRNKEKELEQLKVENLQSQCDALANQINPHFFFNSLNGLTSLIRKNDNEITLTYVNKLSDVFRYILQSDKKGLVSLEEELEFVDAFRYMMEVRFANKLEYQIEVDKDVLTYKIPVLSILPLLDNIVVHNMIDSEHKMVIDISLNDTQELVVSNPIYPKLTIPITNGTGLRNLENRFTLLKNRQIRIENDGTTFRVYLPLI